VSYLDGITRRPRNGALEDEYIAPLAVVQMLASKGAKASLPLGIAVKQCDRVEDLLTIGGYITIHDGAQWMEVSLKSKSTAFIADPSWKYRESGAKKAQLCLLSIQLVGQDEATLVVLSLDKD
jgi:hypothetical protein